MHQSHALAHQCHACRRHWALRIVDHPSGRIVLCRYCSAIRATSGTRRLAVAYS
ncbi:MAG TPA: hypothetical protein VK204_02660 [Nocardioidaceae bacterium]|nr:hypothetical protein [Nocardioidaceae bacterium]